MTSTMDQSKPVIGYPPGYNQAQPSYHPTGYPPAQSSHPTPAGIAYPYAVPAPAAYYNPNPYPAPPHDSRRTTLLRRLIAATIVVLAISGTITFIMWLVLRPQLPQFSVTSASVSPFNVSASQITANWDIVFLVRNPNKKMSIFYDRIQTSVFYRDEFLSETSLAPFSLGKKNQTTVRARFAALSAYVDDRVVKEIADDRAGGTVNFNVRMLAWVRFKTGAWRMRKRFMRVFCDGVRVRFSSNTGPGTLLSGSRECEVDL